MTSEAIECLPDLPLSILGVSHRSDYFVDIVDELEANFREIIGIPETYRCVFLQGGGSLQFSMIAMNFLRKQSLPAAYIDSGYWSHKALREAALEGEVDVVWSGKDENYVRLPKSTELCPDRDFSYLHYSSNETVEGLQFFENPVCSQNTHRICDASSDFLSRPINMEEYGMIYAHAQKNLGPAGVNISIIHESLLERCPDDLHSMLDYRNHIRMKSIFNTPPVFAMYVVLLVTRWLKIEIGGLEAMQSINQRKSKKLYDLLDSCGPFYKCRTHYSARSMMNVAFRLPTVALESQFLEEAIDAGFHGLEGHRSIGGLRASLYNPVTEEAVEELTKFMKTFFERNG